MVHKAKELVEEMNIDAEILDLRTLLPIDYDAVETTVKKTNRVIILHEDTLFGGIGGELSAHISEHYFEHLDAPVMRAAGLDTPIPFAKTLEKDFMPLGRLREKLDRMIKY